MGHPTLTIGRTYFTRDPGADNYVGRLVAIVDPFTVALEDASWVADSGRLHIFIQEGKADGMEIEFVGRAPCVRFRSIIEWNHKVPLPTT